MSLVQLTGSWRTRESSAPARWGRRLLSHTDTPLIHQVLHIPGSNLIISARYVQDFLCSLAGGWVLPICFTVNSGGCVKVNVVPIFFIESMDVMRKDLARGEMEMFFWGQTSWKWFRIFSFTTDDNELDTTKPAEQLWRDTTSQYRCVIPRIVETVLKNSKTCQFFHWSEWQKCISYTRVGDWISPLLWKYLNNYWTYHHDFL